MISQVTRTKREPALGGFFFFSPQSSNGESIRSVASWLYHGGESVFLQDADSLIMKTDDLLQVISLIRETFPSVRRITSYCYLYDECFVVTIEKGALPE